MAWMRMMGVDSVEYHRSTVLARGADHPGQALAYYASRGETPLLWAGRGAAALGLSAAADLTGISATDSVSRAASPAGTSPRPAPSASSASHTAPAAALGITSS